MVIDKSRLDDVAATVAESRRLRETARRARQGLGPVVERLVRDRVAARKARLDAIDTLLELTQYPEPLPPAEPATATGHSGAAERHDTAD